MEVFKGHERIMYLKISIPESGCASSLIIISPGRVTKHNGSDNSGHGLFTAGLLFTSRTVGVSVSRRNSERLLFSTMKHKLRFSSLPFDRFPGSPAIHNRWHFDLLRLNWTTLDHAFVVLAEVKHQ